MQDHRDGEGCYMWANGDVYKGRWRQSKINGRGVKVRSAAPRESLACATAAE